jgi:hypothetical protein
MDLVKKIPQTLLLHELTHRRIIIGSYGVGGALNTFLAAYLFHKFNVTPDMILNFGAPFMSDRTFTKEVIQPIRREMGFKNWWNIEVVNIIDADQRDTISESFNRNSHPYIDIDWSVLCVAYILPYYDIAIYDMSNYKIPFIGFNCE